MLIWFLFLAILFFLFALYNKVTFEGKKCIYHVVTIIIIYFSAFRDGLGMDYAAYDDICNRIREFPEDIKLLSEPIYVSFTNFICSSIFSSVLFFIVTSIVINAACSYVYFRSYGYCIATFFYVCFPFLYIFSFNIVRQFFVASIFLLISFIWVKLNKQGDQKIKKICLMVILVTMFFIHKSSILLVPIILFSNYYIKPIWATLILVITFLVPLSNISGLNTIMTIMEGLDYDIYMDYDSSGISKYSLTNIYMNILTVVSLFALDKYFKNKNSNLEPEHKSFYRYSYIMIFYCMVAMNLCANGFNVMYRVATYFLVFLPVTVGILPRLIKKEYAYSLIIIPTMLLLMTRFIGGDELLLPNRILPILSVLK